jgi:P4 family phage/plasmid primase-like protien
MNHYIQILSLRPFVSKKTGKISLSDRNHYKKGWRITNLQNLFANIEGVIDQIPKEERYNLFYTTSNCVDDPKTPRVGAFQQCVPYDIDGIDMDRIDEYINPILEVVKAEYFKTVIVSSGNGLQFIVYLNQPICEKEAHYDELRPAYKAICDKIDSALDNLGLPGNADPSVWSPARLMRLPLTENRKPMNTFDKSEQTVKKAKLIQRILEPVDYDLHAVADIPLTKSGDFISADELKRFPNPDSAFVQSECMFLRHCAEDANSVSEPQWYAMLSILAHLENGRELCHEYSAQSDQYNYNETDEKIDQALRASGPRTCKNIETIFDGCPRCPHYNSCTSPITLQGPDYIKTKETKFHEVKFNEKTGNLSYGQPNYEDLKRHFSNEHKFVSTMGKVVYVYDETHWKIYEDNRLEAYAQRYFEDLCTINKAREFKEYIQRCNQVTDSFFGSGIAHKMNFKNGILNLDDMSFVQHTSNCGFRYVLDYDYDPEAECPKFDKFMDDITLKREELKNILLEYAGYAFSSMDYKYHKCLILEGEGSNGKSTFVNVLKHLAGQHAYSSLRLNELSSPQNRYDLIGKIFNLAEETPKKGLADSSIFKILTSGGAFTVKQLYKQPYTVNANSCKMIMSANDLPDLSDFSEGLFRRLLIVPFEAKFVEGKNADPDIENKLTTELAGIFNRVIEGYHRLVKGSGFSRSAIVKDRITEYRIEQDTVAQWFYDEVDVVDDSNAFRTSRELYSSYVNYLKPINVKPVTKSEFGRNFGRLAGVSTSTKRLNGRVQRGYRCVDFYKQQF